MIVASNSQGGFDTGNAQLSSIEQIRNDLENDDIFTLVYRGTQEDMQENEDLGDKEDSKASLEF